MKVKYLEKSKDTLKAAFELLERYGGSLPCEAPLVDPEVYGKAQVIGTIGFLEGRGKLLEAAEYADKIGWKSKAQELYKRLEKV